MKCNKNGRTVMLNQGGVPSHFQHLYRLFSTRGFTLIELLVVVLIIGILAAVAVPQYKKAVLKSKFMMSVQITEQLAHALEIYREQQGVYPNDDIKALDISFSGCTISGGGNMFCTDTWYDYGGGNEYYEPQGAHILVAYKSDKQHTIAAGLTEPVFYYKRYLDHSRVTPGKRACYPLTAEGTKLCKSLPGASKQTSGQNANWYFLA